MVFDSKYEHDCVFLGMGFTRVTNEEYITKYDIIGSIK